MSFAPTPEQMAVIAASTGKSNLKVIARAGAGKTSTMKLVAERNSNKRLTVLYFNKANAEEGQAKFPSNAKCSTSHSLAAGYVRSNRDHKALAHKMFENPTAWGIAQLMGLHEFACGEQGFVRVSSRLHGYLVLNVLNAWMRTGDEKITHRHFWPEGKLEALDKAERRALGDILAGTAAKAWLRMIDPSDKMPLGHAGYLQLWAQDCPRISADMIILDEAQDTAPAVERVLRAQKCQVVVVGDPAQAIYEWNGAKDFLGRMDAPSEYLTQSFRFGEGIAAEAGHILAKLGETVGIKGNPKRESKVVGYLPEFDAMLFRTNANMLERVISMVSNGIRPYIVGGTREIITMIDAADELMSGRQTFKHADFMGFQDWSEVVDESEKPEGRQYKLWVRLLNRTTPAAIRSVMASLPNQPRQGTPTLCTAHKSKGLEFGRVVLNDDLLPIRADVKPGQEIVISKEELRLYYVAATRALDVLAIPAELRAKFAVIKSYAEQAKAAA